MNLRGAPELDVSYVPVGAVLALTVHTHSSTLHQLSGGCLKPIPTQVPGRLEIARTLRSLSERVGARIGVPWEVSIGWETLPASVDVSIRVADVVAALDQGLEAILADQVGREAWKARGSRLRISGSLEAAVCPVEGGLELHGALEDDDVISPEPLLPALEAVL